jgi:hypothetical protein
MATESPANEFEAFYAFLGQLRQEPVASLSPEESLRRFRETQEQLRKFHEGNRVAISQSEQGLSAPLDLEALLERVENRVAQQGLSR